MSNNTSFKLKQSARKLLVYEAATGSNTSGVDGSALFRVCDKLRGSLSKNIGVNGFCSLQSRALSLAAAEVSWLRELRLKADGSFAGLGELEAKLDLAAIAEGEAVLMAQLLGLLLTFIGPALTEGLLREVWPKMGDIDLEK